MDSSSSHLPEATTAEAVITIAASESIMGTSTIHHSSTPLLVNEDSDEETKDKAHLIMQSLQLIQVTYLVIAGIVTLLFAMHSIVAFAVLVVAFLGYFGLFWYNAASSARTRGNAIALFIRSFSVAAVLAASSQSFSYNSFFPPSYELFIMFFMMNILILLVVSFLDWRWNGLIS